MFCIILYLYTNYFYLQLVYVTNHHHLYEHLFYEKKEKDKNQDCIIYIMFACVNNPKNK